MKRVAFILLLALTGCASTTSQIPDAVRQGVYLVNDTLHAQRYDQAVAASDQLVRIVPAPRVRLHVTPALKLRQPVAILPANSAPTVTAGTPAFDELKLTLAPVPQFALAVDAQTDKDAADRDKALAKVEAQKITIASKSKYEWIFYIAVFGFLAVGAFVLFLKYGTTAAVVAAKLP